MDGQPLFGMMFGDRPPYRGDEPNRTPNIAKHEHEPNTNRTPNMLTMIGIVGQLKERAVLCYPAAP
jgi:hypothetical protein